MIIKFSKELILSDWYQIGNDGENWSSDYIRSDINFPQLSFKTHCASEISRVYFYRTVSMHYGLVFVGQINFMNKIYKNIYGDCLTKFQHGQVEKIKDFTDNFLKKIINLKIYA